jgi:hypothetical protein
MLSATPYRPSARGPRRTPGTFRAATAAVALAGAVGLAACGSSSSTSTTQAGVAAYQNKANTICKQAVAVIAPVTSRMKSVEQTKHLPTLADTTALDAAQTKLQKNIAAVTPPPSVKAAADTMNADFAAVVARVHTLLTQYGAQSIAYDARDSTLLQLSRTLDDDLKALGLNACI